jgi:hypothetical protein
MPTLKAKPPIGRLGLSEDNLAEAPQLERVRCQLLFGRDTVHIER